MICVELRCYYHHHLCYLLITIIIINITSIITNIFNVSIVTLYKSSVPFLNANHHYRPIYSLSKLLIIQISVMCESYNSIMHDGDDDDDDDDDDDNDYRSLMLLIINLC